MIEALYFLKSVNHEFKLLEGELELIILSIVHFS